MGLGRARGPHPGAGGGLTGRAVAAGLLLALVVGTAFAVLLSSISDLRRSQLRQQRSAEVLTMANRLERLIIDMETGQRGFALTGQEQFLQPWQAAIAAYPGQIATLERLVADAPQQHALARRIATAGASYIHHYSIPLVEAARRDPATARSVQAAAEGKRRMDGMRADFDALVAAQQSLARAEQRSSDQAARRASAAGLGGLIVSLALIATYSAYLTRAIAAPVRRVAATARRLAAGDLAARVPSHGAGEIGLLQRSFNTMAATLARQRTELAASRSRIVTSADQARRRIERDLHDGIQQRLVSLVLDIRTAQSTLPADRPQVAEQLDRLADGLVEAVDELREISRGIHPAILSEAGLGPALKALARRSPIPAELEVEVPRRLPEPVEVAAYYVVSEALANTAKHAQATHVSVRAHARDGVLHLQVRDDGVGGASAEEGSGLVGLADRVEALEGTLTVLSPPGQGTTLLAALPYAGR
ncbi:CHASE3 domain-containing protein [Thermoactinospora rubra]|uniref:CHASE3 domain-containing protein n=1 Tax=Thermoactinospora rubra TaxID=1088767 RepID=UPI000A1155D8|nr:CHASE3 domain-containing protein [Thermoactinospora rubra]